MNDIPSSSPRLSLMMAHAQVWCLPVILNLLDCHQPQSPRYDHLPAVHIADSREKKLAHAMKQVRLRGLLYASEYAAHLAADQDASTRYRRYMGDKTLGNEKLDVMIEAGMSKNKIIRISRIGTEDELIEIAQKCSGQESEFVGTLVIEPWSDSSRITPEMNGLKSQYDFILICVESFSCEGFSWTQQGHATQLCNRPDVRASFQREVDREREQGP